MKPKHHFISSLAVGGVLYCATHSGAAVAGVMLGGFAIDADHIIDQMWSVRYHAPFRRRPLNYQSALTWFDKFLRPRKLLRLSLVFHSYELLAVLAIAALNLRTPFLMGLLSGHILHLLLDLMRHHGEFRSPLFYSLAFRLTRGFRREQLIKVEYQ